jgi:hypothetical protein
VGLDLGHDPAKTHMRHRLDLIGFGLAAASVTEAFDARSPPEAARVQSFYLTEPMRCWLPITSSPRSRFHGACSRRQARCPQGIELDDLLGLHVARRGFWGATSPISLEGVETMPSPCGNTRWPDPV